MQKPARFVTFCQFYSSNYLWSSVNWFQLSVKLKKVPKSTKFIISCIYGLYFLKKLTNLYNLYLFIFLLILIPSFYNKLFLNCNILECYFFCYVHKYVPLERIYLCIKRQGHWWFWKYGKLNNILVKYIILLCKFIL